MVACMKYFGDGTARPRTWPTSYSLPTTTNYAAHHDAADANSESGYDAASTRTSSGQNHAPQATATQTRSLAPAEPATDWPPASATTSPSSTSTVNNISAASRSCNFDREHKFKTASGALDATYIGTTDYITARNCQTSTTTASPLATKPPATCIGPPRAQTDSAPPPTSSQPPSPTTAAISGPSQAHHKTTAQPPTAPGPSLLSPGNPGL